MSDEKLFSVSEMWNSNSDLVRTANKVACRFWENQTSLLDNMQSFATGWFDRRHQGTKAALSTVQKTCTAQSPVDAFTCYQEWAAGVASRVLEDEIAYQKFLASAVSSVTAMQLQPEPADARVQEFQSRSAA